MDALVIKGPSRLAGTVPISGSKNSALPLLFASLLFEKEVHYTNVPRLWDIETTLHLLHDMGATSQWNKEAGTLTILPKVERRIASYEWVKKMRAGILALGPLVAKFGEARVSLPGGCAIGARPVNFHIDVLRAMGATVRVEEGYIHASVPSQLIGAEIDFPEVTVTGTENALIWAVAATGTTILRNAALEPEVVCLGENLIRWGAQIRGLGTSVIEVRGGMPKQPEEPILIPPDRIETGTWIAAAAITRSELTLQNTDVAQLQNILSVFRDIGIRFESAHGGSELRVMPTEKLLPVDVETEPYPGFPTDMQAQLMAVLCTASGTSRIAERIFENRFMHVAELQRLGAQIHISGSEATITGPSLLQGAPLMATDLRASASLVLAGLASQGSTRVSRIYHLDRGYQRLDQKLRAVGAKIERVKEE